ncbi:MAG: hypothetical protein N4J56_004611 [Chroococcidiopsis sp. SAG 2025]|jgi:predicted DNA-binding protein|uniref:ribbon-helix-helix protein, CopG family n=1 Tax=Chroococcidiopsis sp. SAG 2025 TaxID=171389 RepID=UPI0029371F4C|nr:ribbon-helix-helix protein, CopG family [Chroococcidiopsis sp. SAG 2025]MDV2994957.1 hypothetical protein [Chroococcidiopsis sp. SAG 2025]
MRKRLKESEISDFLSFKLPTSTNRQLKKLAVSTNRKKSEILREALDRYLAQIGA